MTDPHRDQPVVHAGAPLERATAAMILVHGRNASPANILDVVAGLGRDDFSYLAPAAAQRTWYPLSFLAEIPRNEPYLTSALDKLGKVVSKIERAGISKDRILFLGFSQGACLSAEYVFRHADRYGGVLVFSGGLIGPPGTTWRPTGSFAGTPVFLGCSDVDAHIPLHRVNESAAAFAHAGADVTTRIYPGMGHTIVDDEMQFARAVMARFKPRGLTASSV